MRIQQINYMSTKKIILVVDNRIQPSSSECPHLSEHRNEFKGSGYNSTEVDAIDELQRNSFLLKELPLLSFLEGRVANLEQRIKYLEDNSDQIRRKRRIRRKARQINKEFQCPHEECAKYYGSETSLKNHLKIKHGRKSSTTQLKND